MADQTTPPLYVQISDMLVRDMVAGRLLDGERLPPERDMAAEMGIAVGTLRKALADLQDKGLLERVQGSGNYVRRAALRDGVYSFFRLELPGGGGAPSADVLAVERLPKLDTLPRFGTSTEGFRIRRLRRLDGQPVACEEIWLDGSYATAIAPQDLSDSLYLYYRQALGLWITRAEDRLSTGTMPAWAPPPLTPGAVTGYAERISWAQDGARAEVSRTWFDGNKATYVSRLR